MLLCWAFLLKIMDLETVYYTFRNMAEIYGYSKEMTVDDFNEFLQLADFEFLKECKREDEGKTTSMYTDALRPFRTTASISLTAGSGSLPTEYYYPKRVYYDNSGETRPLERVTDEKWEYMNVNSVINPDANWPIYLIDQSTIKVAPETISSVSMVYIKKNLTTNQPSIGFRYVEGVNQYDVGTSVQLLWEEENYVDIVRHMLKLINISVNNVQVAQFLDQQQSIDR